MTQPTTGTGSFGSTGGGFGTAGASFGFGATGGSGLFASGFSASSAFSFQTANQTQSSGATAGSTGFGGFSFGQTTPLGNSASGFSSGSGFGGFGTPSTGAQSSAATAPAGFSTTTSSFGFGGTNASSGPAANAATGFGTGAGAASSTPAKPAQSGFSFSASPPVSAAANAKEDKNTFKFNLSPGSGFGSATPAVSFSSLAATPSSGFGGNGTSFGNISFGSSSAPSATTVPGKSFGMTPTSTTTSSSATTASSAPSAATAASSLPAVSASAPSFGVTTGASAASGSGFKFGADTASSAPGFKFGVPSSSASVTLAATAASVTSAASAGSFGNTAPSGFGSTGAFSSGFAAPATPSGSTSGSQPGAFSFNFGNSPLSFGAPQSSGKPGDSKEGSPAAAWVSSIKNSDAKPQAAAKAPDSPDAQQAKKLFSWGKGDTSEADRNRLSELGRAIREMNDDDDEDGDEDEDEDEYDSDQYNNRFGGEDDDYDDGDDEGPEYSDGDEPEEGELDEDPAGDPTPSQPTVRRTAFQLNPAQSPQVRAPQPTPGILGPSTQASPAVTPITVQGAQPTKSLPQKLPAGDWKSTFSMPSGTGFGDVKGFSFQSSGGFDSPSFAFSSAPSADKSAVNPTTGTDKPTPTLKPDGTIPISFKSTIVGSDAKPTTGTEKAAPTAKPDSFSLGDAKATGTDKPKVEATGFSGFLFGGDNKPTGTTAPVSFSGFSFAGDAKPTGADKPTVPKSDATSPASGTSFSFSSDTKPPGTDKPLVLKPEAISPISFANFSIGGDAKKDAPAPSELKAENKVAPQFGPPIKASIAPAFGTGSATFSFPVTQESDKNVKGGVPTVAEKQAQPSVTTTKADAPIIVKVPEKPVETAQQPEKKSLMAAWDDTADPAGGESEPAPQNPPTASSTPSTTIVEAQKSQTSNVEPQKTTTPSPVSTPTTSTIFTPSTSTAPETSVASVEPPKSLTPSKTSTPTSSTVVEKPALTASTVDVQKSVSPQSPASSLPHPVATTSPVAQKLQPATSPAPTSTSTPAASPAPSNSSTASTPVTNPQMTSSQSRTPYTPQGSTPTSPTGISGPEQFNRLIAQRVSNLTQQVTQLENSFSSGSAATKSLNEKIVTLESQLTEATIKFDRMEKILSEESAEKQRVIDKLTEDNKKKDAEVLKISTELNSLKHNFNQLQNREAVALKDLEAERAITARIRAELSEAKKVAVDKEMKFSSEMTRSEITISTQKSQIEVYSQQLKQLKQQYDGLVVTHEQFKTLAAQTQSDLKAQQVQLEEQSKNIQAQSDRHRKDVEQMLEQLSTLQGERDKAERNNENLAKSLTESKKREDEKDQTIRDLKAAENAIKNEKTNADFETLTVKQHLEKAFKDLNTANETHKDEIKNLGQYITKLKEEVQEKELAILRDVPQLKAVIKQLEKEKSLQEAEISSLQKKFEESEKKFHKLNSHLPYVLPASMIEGLPVGSPSMTLRRAPSTKTITTITPSSSSSSSSSSSRPSSSPSSRSSSNIPQLTNDSENNITYFVAFFAIFALFCLMAVSR